MKLISFFSLFSLTACSLAKVQLPPLQFRLSEANTSCLQTEGYYYHKAPFYSYRLQDSTESVHITFFSKKGVFWRYMNYADSVSFEKIQVDLLDTAIQNRSLRVIFGNGICKCIDSLSFIINSYQPSSGGPITCYKYGRVLNDTTIVIDSIRYLGSTYEPFAYVTDTSYFRHFDAIPDTIPPFIK